MVPKEKNFKIDESEYYKVNCTDLLKICFRIQQIGSGCNPERMFSSLIVCIKPVRSGCSDNLVLDDQLNFLLVSTTVILDFVNLC